MNVTRFHHVSVNCNDTPVAAMVAFYRDVLGLGDKVRPDIPGIAELEERGIDYERALQGEGTVQIWFTDPAGNTIELQQETRSHQ